ncbi:MAG: SWF/SNF helicase family protein [Deltaproteobacteria bacterium]|nr:SWF/SNF helicase family protein [Deltaproteobacteria bacterium]
MRMVDQMRRSTGFRVMLVSPEVGGAGWNLQFANRAVILERPWNPAVESQMIARVHRLGQDRPVEIVVPVATLATRRTYDVILDELLTEKTGLAEAVLAPASMGEDELAGRFKREFGEMG